MATRKWKPDPNEPQPRAVPSRLMAFIPTIVGTYGTVLQNCVPRPYMSQEDIIEHFIERKDHEAFQRVSSLCKKKIATNQTIAFDIRVSGVDGVLEDYTLRFSYTTANLAVFLPDQKGFNVVKEMYESDLMQDALEYAQNYAAVDTKVAHFYGLVRYLAFACKNVAELKCVWPDFLTIFDSMPSIRESDEFERYAAKFQKTKSSNYVPTLFPGVGQMIEDARTLIGVASVAVGVDETPKQMVVLTIQRVKASRHTAPWAGLLDESFQMSTVPRTLDYVL